MPEHFKFIAEVCDVREIRGDYAIFYFDDGCGYAEIDDNHFECCSSREFNELCVMFHR